MQCLKCSNEAEEQNALCADCFADASTRRRSNRAAVADKVKPEKTASGWSPAGQPPHLLRLLAYLCDAALLSVVSFAIYEISIFLFGIDLGRIQRAALLKDTAGLQHLASTIQTAALIDCLSFLIPGWLYFVLFEGSSFQSTPGKVLVGLKVASGGGRAGVDALTKRFLLKYAPSVFSFVLLPLIGVGCFGGLILLPFILVALLATTVFTLINPFFVLFTAERTALHDIAAGTQVIKDQDLGWKGPFVCFVLFLLAIGLRILFALLIGR